METGIFIKYTIILASILGVAYLSQQAFFNKNSKTFIYGVTNQASAYLASASNWATSKIYPNISGAVQNGGDMIKNNVEGVTQEKNKVSENISEKVSNYFSGIANSVVHPGTPQNCQPAQTSANP
jgi:hypothetical protein